MSIDRFDGPVGHFPSLLLMIGEKKSVSEMTEYTGGDL